MKSFKLILAAALVSSMVMGSAFAQSRMRADEVIQNPQEYRLGDSEDMQGDQIKMEAMKQQRELNQKSIQHQNHLLKKHLIKNSDYI